MVLKMKLDSLLIVSKDKYNLPLPPEYFSVLNLLMGRGWESKQSHSGVQEDEKCMGHL